MSFLTRIVVFWMIVIGAISILRLFSDSLPGRLVFSRQGPLPRGGESRSAYRLRWAGYWGSWVAQCVLVFAACWYAASRVPALSGSLWFLAFWAAVVPVLAAIASFAGLAALAAAAKARLIGPDPVHAHAVESTATQASLER